MQSESEIVATFSYSGFKNLGSSTYLMEIIVNDYLLLRKNGVLAVIFRKKFEKFYIPD